MIEKMLNDRMIKFQKSMENNSAAATNNQKKTSLKNAKMDTGKDSENNNVSKKRIASQTAQKERNEIEELVSALVKKQIQAMESRKSIIIIQNESDDAKENYGMEKDNETETDDGMEVN